MAQPKLLCRYN